MRSRIVSVTISALVAAVVMAPAGPAGSASARSASTGSASTGSASTGSASAGYDVTTALTELTAAAALTRDQAEAGFTSTGGYLGEGQTVIDLISDGSGHGRQVVHTLPEDQINYVSVGIGRWGHIAARTRKIFAAGLAYIGKPHAVYGFTADQDATLDNSAILSGADSVDHLERSRYTFLSADKVDHDSDRLTYVLTGYLDVPAQPTTMTVTLSSGLVTGYHLVNPTAADGSALVFNQTWSYGPQAKLVLPTEEQSTTALDLARSRSAVVLRTTVADHAREVGRLVKTTARKAKRKTVRVSDVRRAAARTVEKYSDSARYPEDELPTRAASITGGVALYASDPYKNKVRIATVQVVNGKLRVSV